MSLVDAMIDRWTGCDHDTIADPDEKEEAALIEGNETFKAVLAEQDKLAEPNILLIHHSGGTHVWEEAGTLGAYKQMFLALATSIAPAILEEEGMANVACFFALVTHEAMYAAECGGDE